MGQRGTIRAVVFDLDDTLYAERDYVRSGYRAVADRLRAMGRQGDFDEWLWERFLAGKAAGAMDAMNDCLSLGLAPDGVRQLVTVYREHRPAIKPAGGIADFLGRLRGTYLLGLLSDGSLPGQELKLAALGLARFLDAVVFTEKLGREFWKPSPRGFEEVCRMLGEGLTPPLSHGQLAYIADNPAKDFVAPNKLGWLTIRYARPAQVHAANPAPNGGEPQVVAADLKDIHRALVAG